MHDLDTVGRDWAIERIGLVTCKIINQTPSEYNEATRYLPASVTSKPGRISYAINPYMEEIVNCADVNSPIRETNLMKGVQITYSTMLESVLLYFADYIGTDPIMYLTADLGLANKRMSNNFIPMFQHSDLGHIIKSSDLTSTQKTGKTKDHIQFAKGGYMVPFGAKNADKMRDTAIRVMLKDEIDAWPDVVGKDGDPDKLSDARTNGYKARCKIFRGSTPLLTETSKIFKAYKKGDQRKYHVPCRNHECGHMQHLRWSNEDKETGIVGGFMWDLDEEGRLKKETVRYCCVKCGHPHYEHDKGWMFAPANGAEWRPTATAMEEGIRSYHLPGLYSPVGMLPWWQNVLDYIECYDVATKTVKDIGQYQVFYNNVLAEPFRKTSGGRIHASQVDTHRREAYRYGTVPNTYAEQYSDGPILFLTCQIDVHKRNLAVAVMGWTAGARCFLIDYWRFETGDTCEELSDPVWTRARELIEQKVYTSDDGKKYRICRTLVDSSAFTDTVYRFCNEYNHSVYAIKGRQQPGKNQTVAEFAEFATTQGAKGYRITVDMYKDRMWTVLRRNWDETKGPQDKLHFNAPIDATGKQLKELTVEYRREVVDADTGVKRFEWYRPGSVPNELWDLLVYGHANVDIFAWRVCIEEYEMESYDSAWFWAFAALPANDVLFGRG